MVLAMAPEVPPRMKSLRTLFHPDPLLDELPPWCAIKQSTQSYIKSNLFGAITHFISILTPKVTLAGRQAPKSPFLGRRAREYERRLGKAAVIVYIKLLPV